MSEIGERLKETRKKAKCSQQQFADELGISRGHVSNLEIGKDNPSDTIIKLVSMKFNVDEAWIKSGIGSPDPTNHDTSRDGYLSVYENSRVRFERMLRNCSSNDLANIVSAYSALVAILDLPLGLKECLLDKENTRIYVKSICCVILKLENLIYNVTLKRQLLPSKHDATGWLEFKNDSNKLLSKLVDHAKNAVNLYLKKYGEQMKL